MNNGGDVLAQGFRGPVQFSPAKNVTDDEWQDRIGSGKRRKRVSKPVWATCADCKEPMYSREQFSKHVDECVVPKNKKPRR